MFAATLRADLVAFPGDQSRGQHTGKFFDKHRVRSISGEIADLAVAPDHVSNLPA